MKFRIKHIESLGYFPYVQQNLIWGLKDWMRIGRHSDGFGLYREDGHPYKTEQEAMNVCKEYKAWCIKRDAYYAAYNNKPTYTEFDV